MSARNLKKAPSQNDYQSICGLDALYFSVKVNINDYTQFYHNHLLKNHINSDDMQMLTNDFSKQFTFFQYFAEIENDGIKASEGISPIRQKICRIGFKNLNERDNLDFIYVQMESNALQQMTIKTIMLTFTNLLNTFGLVPLKFQLSRVDLNTYLFDYDFNWLNYNYFSTKLKINEPKYNGDVLETFYLGSRGNGLFFRIYDKVKQLRSLEYKESNIKEGLIGLKYLYKYHKQPDYEKIWNVEVELRREQLKYYKVDTLQDLEENVNSLHYCIFSNSARLLEEKCNKDGNDNRIKNHTVWQHIIDNYDYNGEEVVVLDKEKLKEYKRDNTWLKNRLIEFLQESNNKDLELNKKVNELFLLLKSKI